MESNTQKGCMIGCLASVGIFVGLVFAIVLFFWSIHIVKNRLNME